MMPFYTHVPDDFFDEELKDLSGSEVKVMLVIFRKTFGFKVDKSKISIKYIELYSGLSHRSVVSALKSLEAKGHIRIERRKLQKSEKPLTSMISVKFIEVDRETAHKYWMKRKEKLAQEMSDKTLKKTKKAKIKPKSQPFLTLL